MLLTWFDQHFRFAEGVRAGAKAAAIACVASAVPTVCEMLPFRILASFFLELSYDACRAVLTYSISKFVEIKWFGCLLLLMLGWVRIEFDYRYIHSDALSCCSFLIIVYDGLIQLPFPQPHSGLVSLSAPHYKNKIENMIWVVKCCSITCFSQSAHAIKQDWEFDVRRENVVSWHDFRTYQRWWRGWGLGWKIKI